MSNTLGYLCIMLLLLFASMAVSAQDENGITIQTNGPTKITIENQPDPAPGNIG